MQVHKLSNGNYVAHDVRFCCSANKFSIWYDASGAVTDIDAIDKLGRANRRVPASVQRKAPLMFARVKLCAEMDV
jgi:hypothetical protein